MADSQKKDIFNDDNAVKSAWVTWGKPGNFIQGTLAAKYERENNLNGKTEMQTIYEVKASGGEFNALKQDDNGNYVPVEDVTTLNAGDMWNIGGKAAVDSQMRNVKIGQIVGIKFMESVPAKEKGRYPTKVVKVFTAGEMDQDFLTGMEEAAAAADPSNF
jgi:hypothetical protein